MSVAHLVTDQAPMKRFRVAFSFAGEKRAFVADVANIIARQFGKDSVLYDKFHEAEFSDPGLALKLPMYYRDGSDLVVVVLCPNYEEKTWCGLEWRAVYGMIKDGRDTQVMLCRYNSVEPPVLHGLAGYIDLDAKTPDELATLVLKRLAIIESAAKDHYTHEAPHAQLARDWPEAAPDLVWPMADHREAQQAFAQLITRDSKFRILPIYGDSETGKSSLTKQFLRNAVRLDGVRCARLDFKGSADIGRELRTFAEQLELPALESGSVSIRLAQVLAALQASIAPTLLIFDTFEAAEADAERWIRDTLLLAVVRRRWLRVAIVGQRTTQPSGEAWEDHSHRALGLSSPTPQHWFDFARTYNADVQIEFVQDVHAYCRGKSSELAQLFGPGGTR
jgi:hypothetical protein